jgi:hypothetical protein
MSLRDYPDAFENQDIINLLSTEELRELSNLKEMRRSLTAVIGYMQERESGIFKAVRARLPKQGEPHVD